MSAIKNYYYDMLGKEQQKAYYAIKNGLSNIEDSFMVPKLPGEQLADIYFMVRMDHPELFYSITYKYRYYPDSVVVEMVPEYIFTKDKIKDHKKALETRIKKLILPMQDKTDREKELYVHDFICNNVTYDKLKKPYSHEIIGPLENGVGVCEGIAKTVKILCDELEIPCIIALSEANPEKGIKYRHAWNIIKIDNKYYHLDATFDNTISKKEIVRYDYFNLADKQFFRDHEPVIWKVPVCEDNDKFYYKDKKLSWTTLEEVQNRVKQAVKKKKPLVFHWRGGYLTKDVFQNIVAMIIDEAKAKERHALISVNWPQAVFYLRVEDGVGAEQVEMEEANQDRE